MAGQVPSPALEISGVIPEAVGNHHESICGGRGGGGGVGGGGCTGLPDHHRQGLGTVGHVNFELPARTGELPVLQPGPLAAHRWQGGNQLFGLTALGPESLHRIAQPAQLHRDALAGKILQHIQQADPPFGGRQLQCPVKLGRLNWLRQAVDVTEGSHQQQHLLQQGRSIGIEQYGLQLQGQVGLQHRFELLTDNPVGGPVEFGQIAITSKQGRRAAQFGNPDEEVGLQQGQPQPDGFNRSGRWRGQQRSGAKPRGQSTN